MQAEDIKTFKISNGALKCEKLPTRLKIFGWGDNDTIDGTYRAGHKTAAVLSANQRRLGYERVAIDFDHSTVPGSETNKQFIGAGEVPPVFGYGRVNAIPGDGIYLEDISWTPLGVKHAQNFEDISPAIKDENREVILIHSIALTPNGKVNGLQFFSTNQPNKKNMQIEIADLAGVVGLSATATKDEVLAKLKTALTPQPVDITPLSARITTLETKLPAGSVDITPLSARIEKIEQEITAGKTAAADAARAGIIKLFSADGKVPKKADGTAYSADELKVLDVPTLQLLHANTPVTVPLSARAGAHQIESAKTHRIKTADGKEIVDMGGIFDDEAARSGLTTTPTV